MLFPSRARDSMGQIRIVSNGKAMGTTIIDEATGETIDGVTKVEITIDPNGGHPLPYAVIHVHKPILDIIAENVEASDDEAGQ